MTSIMPYKAVTARISHAREVRDVFLRSYTDLQVSCHVTKKVQKNPRMRKRPIQSYCRF